MPCWFISLEFSYIHRTHLWFSLWLPSLTHSPQMPSFHFSKGPCFLPCPTPPTVPSLGHLLLVSRGRLELAQPPHLPTALGDHTANWLLVSMTLLSDCKDAEEALETSLSQNAVHCDRTGKGYQPLEVLAAGHNLTR